MASNTNFDNIVLVNILKSSEYHLIWQATHSFNFDNMILLVNKLKSSEFDTLYNLITN